MSSGRELLLAFVAWDFGQPWSPSEKHVDAFLAQHEPPHGNWPQPGDKFCQLCGKSLGVEAGKPYCECTRFGPRAELLAAPVTVVYDLYLVPSMGNYIPVGVAVSNEDEAKRYQAMSMGGGPYRAYGSLPVVARLEDVGQHAQVDKQVFVGLSASPASPVSTDGESRAATVVKVTEIDGRMRIDDYESHISPLDFNKSSTDFMDIVPPESIVPQEHRRVGPYGHFRITVEFTPSGEGGK